MKTRIKKPFNILSVTHITVVIVKIDAINL